MTTPLLLFSGGRADSVVAVDSANPPAETTNGFVSWDSSYADCALMPNGGAVCGFTDASGAAASVVAGHTAYFHFEYSASNSASNGAVIVELRDSSGNPWLRLTGTTGGQHKFQYNSGSSGSPTWTDFTSSAYTPAYRAHDLAVAIDSAGNHSLTFILNGATVWTKTFTNAGLTNLASAVIFTNGNGLTGFSQLMATQDLSTVGAKVKTIRATGAGTYAQMIGAYTDVNEILTSDATFNQSTAAAQTQSYAMADISVPAGMVIKGVRHCFRVKNDGANAPLNVKSLCRSGGSDYTSGNLSGVGAGFAPVGKRYDVDPNTATAWTQAAINAVEFGFTSAA